jgi:methyl-accepting chemotaxis protein
MKLTPKLIISFLTLGILPLLVFGIISVNTADSGLKSLAHQQLESVRDLKKKTIERYFETIDAQVITLADTQVVLQAMFYLPTQVKTYAALADKNADQLPSYKDALTANTSEEDRKAAFESGMNDFMTKPFEPNKIQKIIQVWLDQALRTAN